MAAHTQSFYCLWQDEHILETLFALLSKEDICAIRLANSACCNLLTRRLFRRTHLTFTASTFTKPSRVTALSRIGHHIEHLTFSLPHSDATFLPPLLHPLTGREISFLYTPHTSMASVLTRPKYSNVELGDVLTQQYPPLFHAATNVPSFLHAMKHLPNMRHLTIACPGQDPAERYRRSIVDYALISLRISLERAPLRKLSKLTLAGVHPAAFCYLRHMPGFGAVPSAARRWRQIRKLYVSVDAWDFYGPSPGLDHLKILDAYIRDMAPHLEKFSFTWLSGAHKRRGPCPLALSGDPLFAPLRSGPPKLFNEVTSPMSPLPPQPRREPMAFPRLRCLTLRNTAMQTPQLSNLVERLQTTIRVFNCENVSLVDGGRWDDAFAPLLRQVSRRGSTLWARDTRSGSASPDVHASVHKTRPPLRSPLRSPLGSPSAASSIVTYGPPAVASPDDVQISSPSAAVAAISRGLLDLEDPLDVGSDWEEVSPRPLSGSRTHSIPGMHPAILEEDEDEDEDGHGGVSIMPTANETALTFTTELKKKKRRRRRRHRDGDGAEEQHSSHRHRHRHDEHQRSHSDKSHRPRRPKDAEAAASKPHPFAHRQQPPPPRQSSDTDDVFRPQTPLRLDDVSFHTPSVASAMVAPLAISAPLLDAKPLPVLLQPTVYDPSARQLSGSAPRGDDEATLSPVQQHIEREEAQRRQNHLAMAEDADARSAALQKAKEAVLAKLSREFHRRMGHEAIASTASAAAASVSASMRADLATSPSLLGGLRWRERLFGDALSASSDFHQHRSFESSSAVVPLIFSRA